MYNRYIRNDNGVYDRVPQQETAPPSRPTPPPRPDAPPEPGPPPGPPIAAALTTTVTVQSVSMAML